MRTDDLIEQLAASVPPVRRNAAARRLCAGIGCGAIIAFAALAAWLGVRPDIAEASSTAAFWMKWVFTVSIGSAAFVALRRLGRPDGEVGRAWWGLLAPVAIVGMMAVVEVLRAPPQDRLDVWLGHTALQCALAIPALAGPVFAGLLWGFRRLAPTRLRLAGAAAGLLAGAAGASVYAFTCPEQTAAFMVTWYDAGILAAGAIGALVGPRLLRW
jgi:hypothetical protein